LYKKVVNRKKLKELPTHVIRA